MIRLSALHALLGHIPPSLRAVSVGAEEGPLLIFRCYFDSGATSDDKELLSEAAAEVIAHFTDPWTIKEEYLDLAAPRPMEHLEFLVFLRHEPATDGV
jgi:hypothetical protein